MNQHLRRIIVTFTVTTTTAVALSGLVGFAPLAGAEGGSVAPSGCHLSAGEVSDWGDTSTHLQQACDPEPYTTLDHPAKACHLSPAAVANWGETSAHLPLACTYR